MEKLFIENTNIYAREVKNFHSFELTPTKLWSFLTIITISAYNQRPQSRLYWSKDDDVNCPLISQLMSPNEFEQVKSFLHVVDNNDLCLTDRWAKLRPLIDLVNEKLKQFGINSKYLSIDEQIVPYFGHHRCKMYHKEKPIRFGFQNWVLATDDGTPIHFFRMAEKVTILPMFPLELMLSEIVRNIFPTQRTMFYYLTTCSVRFLC